MNPFALPGTTVGESVAVGVMLALLLVGIGVAAVRFEPAVVRSRFNVALIGGLLSVALVATVGWWYEVPGYRVLVSAVLWGGIGLYVVGTVIWLGLRAIAHLRYTEPEPVFGHDDIQVRIMTIDAEAVVQETVDALPDTITDRHVVAEAPIEIDGAEVHVVPDEFSCEATRKGRALEWARRTIACEREHILYLDEDTIVTEFDGLPDADIVQFGERPYRTGGLIPYLSEMFRIGFQLEQRTFGLLPVPLYAWGGGIAIRTSLEREVTWNYDTLIEDTVFTWRAVSEYDASFVTLRTWFYNQAPATLGAMVSQRRRWIGGAEEELSRLPWYYRSVFRFRNFVWGMTPLASVIPLSTVFFPGVVHLEQQYLQVSFLLLLTPLLWSILGYEYFKEVHLIGALTVPFTPLITIGHSAGAFLGLLSRPGDFETTEKVGESAKASEASPVNDGGLSRSGRLRYHLGRVAGAVKRRASEYLNAVRSAGSDLFVAGHADGAGLPFERRHVELRPTAILGIITAVGAAVRFYGLGGASYWVDEIYSVVVRGDMPIGDLLTASEPHPPLYYLLLKFWMMAFGQGEFATRSLSALFGVGAIVAIYFLCKELFDRSAGYIGAALMALSTFHVHTSQTTRMYEPLTFFMIVSLYFMIRVLSEGGYKNGAFYTLSTVGMLFTHLFGGFVVLAQNAYVLGVLVVNSEQRWSRLKRWLVTEGLVSVIYLSFLFTVFLPQLLAKARGGSKASWITVPTLESLEKALMAIGRAPAQYPFNEFSWFSMNVSVLFLVLAMVAIVLGTTRYDGGTSDNRLFGVRLNKVGGRGKLLGITVFACCFVLPLVLSFVITPIFVNRYMSPATIGAVITIAGGVATIRRDSVRVAVMLGLIVSSAGLVGMYHQTSTTEDWRAASDYITSGESTVPLIVLEPAWIDEALDFYGLPPRADIVGAYQGWDDFGRADAGDLGQAVRSHDTVYVIRRSPSVVDSTVEEIEVTHRKVEQQEFGVITVYKFTRRSSGITSDGPPSSESSVARA